MKIFLLILLVIAVAQALLLKAEEGGMAAARVNGVSISEYRLERYFAEYLEDQGRPITGIRSPSLYKRLREQALQTMIDKELLFQEATRRGIRISDSNLQARLDSLRNAFPSRERYARALAEAGFDEASFADYTRHEMAAQQVYLDLTRVPEPTPEQIQAFYQEGKDQQSPAANQTAADSVEREQGLALAKNLLIEQRQAQAHEALLQRLRSQSRIERIDAR